MTLSTREDNQQIIKHKTATKRAIWIIPNYPTPNNKRMDDNVQVIKYKTA